MVADVHRTMLYGGIYCYPGDAKNPRGKLRLMYENNPLAYIVEQAGGACSNGEIRTMEVRPKSLHERSPLFIGSVDDVRTATDFVSGKRT
jgi:fructose-1,6-bisphosphatase I